MLLWGKRIVLLGLLFFVSEISNAQKAKFGKITEAELAMSSYEPDPSASAVVLFDVARSYTDLSNSSGVTNVFTRHKRVKILKNDGYDVANIEIPFYAPESEGRSVWEDVYAIKAYTHELVDGKIVSHKLEKTAIFEERVNEFFSLMKISMPKISEGVVFEITYKIQSPGFDMPNWSFQDYIPVKYSEYKTEYPEFCNFYRASRGYFPFNQRAAKSRPIPNYSYAYIGDFMYAENVPAFQEEEFTANADEYLSRVIYQLKNITIPGYVYQDFAKSWGKVLGGYMGSPRFGKALNKEGAVDELVATLVKPEQSPEEKMSIIYHYVRDQIKWNGHGGFGLENGIRKTLSEKSGNVGDKNLLLTLMLNAAGLESNPVLVSTRKHGVIRKFNPQYGAFNYVISSVYHNEEFIFMDACDEMLPLGMLPFKCMNGEGAIIDWVKKGKDSYTWIIPKNNIRNSESTSANVSFDEDMNLKGSLTVIKKGYKALSARKGIAKSTPESFVENSWKNTQLNIEGFEVENTEEVAKPLKTELKINLADLVNGDRIYLNPSLLTFFEENPFKSEKREYPVDFGTASSRSYTFSLAIPEGYEIEELPKNTSIVMPDKSASFKYLIGTAGGNLQLRTTFILKQSFYLMDNYPFLKQLFDEVIAKQSEQIVLRKVQ